MQLNRVLALSPRLLALVPLAVGINIAMGQFAEATALPVFLDTIGTVLLAALAGPVPAVVTGIISQTVRTLVSGNSTLMPFVTIQIVVALYAGFAAKMGVFASLPRAALAGLVLGFLAGTLAWPISLFLFGGVTGGGITVLTATLRAIGLPLEVAVFVSSLTNDLLDKTLTFLLIRTVLTSLPKRMAARFPLAQRALGRAG
jgi:energy-coupling factor transport system substrate-specific component